MSKLLTRTIYERLVRNYIRSGKEDHASQGKVVWPILTSPKLRGGLGLIDPLSQSKALLAKFVVRGLQPGKDYWKMLLRLRFAYFRP